jgi:hypothetical protein
LKLFENCFGNPGIARNRAGALLAHGVKRPPNVWIEAKTLSGALFALG